MKKHADELDVLQQGIAALTLDYIRDRVTEKKSTNGSDSSEIVIERRASSLRRAHRGERLAVYLPPQVLEAVKVRCVRERRSVSDAITVAVHADWRNRANRIRSLRARKGLLHHPRSGRLVSQSSLPLRLQHEGSCNATSRRQVPVV